MMNIKFLMLASLLMLACNSNNHVKDYELVGQQFYSLRMAENVDAVLKLFGPQAYKEGDSLSIRTFFAGVRQKFGPIDHSELVRVENSYINIGGKSEKRISLFYSIRYRSGDVINEELRFFPENKFDNKIDGYSFNVSTISE